MSKSDKSVPQSLFEFTTEYDAKQILAAQISDQLGATMVPYLFPISNLITTASNWE